jgi:hypothetical protein
MARIPSINQVADAVLHFPVRDQPRAVLRLPRVVMERTGDALKGRWETVDEWQAQNDPEGQQVRLMNEVRHD